MTTHQQLNEDVKQNYMDTFVVVQFYFADISYNHIPYSLSHLTPQEILKIIVHSFTGALV